VAAYRASVDEGKPLSERKLAAMFGKTSRRWARNRMAEAIPCGGVKIRWNRPGRCDQAGTYYSVTAQA
jgi:hypothetical protein